MDQTYTRRWVAENVHDMTMTERTRALNIIQRQKRLFDHFVESLSPEERDSPLGRAFIERVGLQFESMETMFPYIPFRFSEDNG